MSMIGIRGKESQVVQEDLSWYMEKLMRDITNRDKAGDETGSDYDCSVNF